MNATTIERPSAEVTPPDGPRRPRRWGGWAALALGALLIASGIGTYAFLRHYEPLLEVGDGFSGSATPVDATAVTTAYLRVPYRENGAFAFSVLLWNDGRLPVTIEDPGRLAQTGASLFHPTAVDMYLSPDGGNVPFDSVALTPFHSVTIEPTSGLYLVYRGQLRGCTDFEPGSATRYGSITMRTRSFFVDHTFMLALNQPLQFEAPGTCAE
jgi:hypothetical protein